MAGNSKETSAELFQKITTEEERRELLSKPHHKHLEEAFRALTEELDTNGYSERFNTLRGDHAQLLLQYWAAKKAQFESLVPKNNPYGGHEVRVGDEKISGVAVERYEDEDDKVLDLEIQTPYEKASFSMTVNTERGLDEFMNPPTIESEVSMEPGETPDFYYKLVFRNGRISTMTRTHIRIASGALGELGGYLKDTRQVDCSLFGVETR